ncbi:MAG: lysylphosphatidylglycerol synthase transmembrane domain-containing protein [Coriobacteriia bacterium]|nr:lysylphosphatidylglycerol synthase transmembrane domain-containing protein [Coriobacteriia bacterium]
MADELKKPKKKVALKVSGAASSKAAAEDAEADKESMGQVRKSLVFLAFVVVAYMAYLVISGQFDEFVASLSGVDMGWIASGVVCFLFYYVFGVLAYVLSVIADPDSPVGIRDLMSVEASGVFFMRLTPNGAAAPPAQIYRLTRAGLNVGQASALNFTRFVLYEAGEGVFAAIMLIFCGSYFYEQFGDVTLIGVFLFGFKVVQVGAVLFLCLFPRPVTALGNWALRLANRHGWLKDEKYDEYYNLVNNQVAEFSAAFKGAAKNVGEMCATMVVTLLQLGCMYALPYFVLRAFGEPADFMVCLASGSMLELLINAVPLPGGTGGAEVGFAYLFSDMFGSHLAAGFVIWRAVEYLLPVLIAAPCMGMRSNSGVSINRRWHRIWGGFTGAIRGFIDTGSFKGGAKGVGGGKRAQRGAVTVKPKAKKSAGAGPAAKPSASKVRTLESGAKVTTRGSKTVVTGTAPAPQVDIAAKIAAGKAAAKKPGSGK